MPATDTFTLFQPDGSDDVKILGFKEDFTSQQ
jgi:hypothetical protein